MTKVYFIRHAEPNYNNHNDALRELTSKGMEDRKRVTKFLDDKQIDVVLSSPYKRAIYNSFRYSDFEEIKNIMPWIVEFVFDEDTKCIEINKYNLA